MKRKDVIRELRKWSSENSGYAYHNQSNGDKYAYFEGKARAYQLAAELLEEETGMAGQVDPIQAIHERLNAFNEWMVKADKLLDQVKYIEPMERRMDKRFDNIHRTISTYVSRSDEKYKEATKLEDLHDLREAMKNSINGLRLEMKLLLNTHYAKAAKKTDKATKWGMRAINGGWLVTRDKPLTKEEACHLTDKLNEYDIMDI